MRYIEVKAFGGADELQLFEGNDPKAAAGELVVDVKAAGINFADIMARKGNYPNVPSAPYRPGCEIAGVVREVGASVTGVAVGDRVVSLSPAGGGYATQAVVPSAAAIKLPENFDFGVAAGLLVQGMTAYFMLREANLAPGETVLATGAAGGVGSMAVQMARAQGAKVIGLASKAKHDRVKQNGAFAVVDYTVPGWSKQVLDLTAGKGINVYLDAEGNFGGEAYDALARKARWVVYGIQTDKPSALPLDKQWDYIFKNVSLRGYTIDTDFGNFPTGMRQAIEWAQRGELKVEVTRFPLAKATEAHEAIEARKTTGKVVLEP